MDKIVEAIKADIRTHFANDIQADIVARAALAVAGPMVLEETMGVVRQYARKCDVDFMDDAIRNLKEQFNG